MVIIPMQCSTLLIETVSYFVNGCNVLLLLGMPYLGMITIDQFQIVLCKDIYRILNSNVTMYYDSDTSNSIRILKLHVFMNFV